MVFNFIFGKEAKLMYKLMLVEDEPIIREGLKHYFDWNNLQFQTIIEASNGLEGLTLARKEKPELIITDIRMPLMNGLDMIAQLREELPNSQFIILTGHTDFEYAQHAIRIGGITEYLIKPLQYEASLSTIHRCLKNIKEKLFTAPPLEDNCINLKQEDSNEIFNKMKKYIVDHIDQDISLPELADKFFYNPSYLSRLFKQRLNKSFSQFHTEIRIDYAKECLSNPNILVLDVSTKCGYKSYKHFVKIFKEMTRMTPTEYRKRLGYT